MTEDERDSTVNEKRHRRALTYASIAASRAVGRARAANENGSHLKVGHFGLLRQQQSKLLKD